MLLKSIRLENFRQYKDEYITFSTDKDKNITVILGKNTGGKTTLVKAFLWCFYGRNSDSEFKDKSYLNEYAKQEMIRTSSNSEQPVTVSVDLIYNGKEYRVTRTEKYIRRLDIVKRTANEIFRVFIIGRDGICNPLSENEKNTVINQFLPRDLSTYFFFWGERISNITETRSLKSSMHSFFGLTTLESTRSYLNKVKESYQLKAASDGNMILDNLANKLDELRKIKSQKQRLLDETKKEISAYNSELEVINEKRLKLGSMSEKIKRKNELEKFIQKSEADKEKALQEFFKEFNDPSNYIPYYTKKLLPEALKTLSSASQDMSGWAHINKNSIEEIIEKGRCVCGTNVSNDNTAFQNLLSEINQMPPKSIGALIEDFRKTINIKDRDKDKYLERLNSIWDRVSTENELISSHEMEIVELKKDVDESVRETIDNIDKNTSAFKSKIRTLEQKKDEYIKLLGANEAEIKEIENKFTELTKKYKDTQKYNTLLEYTDALIDVCNKHYETGKKEILENLNNYVLKHFDQMYHGNRKISIDENFNVELYNTLHGNVLKLDQSEGLMAVKNFSFISGMIEMARTKLPISNINESLKSEPCPIVLDAPFSHTDETHIPNICKQLCSVAEQTIIVVMEKDWNYAKDSMSDKVGQYYTINKNSEYDSTIIKSGGMVNV